jgi:hypothetical protein
MDDLGGQEAVGEKMGNGMEGYYSALGLAEEGADLYFRLQRKESGGGNETIIIASS